MDRSIDLAVQHISMTFAQHQEKDEHNDASDHDVDDNFQGEVIHLTVTEQLLAPNPDLMLNTCCCCGCK